MQQKAVVVMKEGLPAIHPGLDGAMDSFIMVLIPWFIGNLAANLPVGRQVMRWLSEQKYCQEKKRKNRITNLIITYSPFFGVVIDCSIVMERYFSLLLRNLILYLLVVLLFSGCFFMSIVWMKGDSKSK